MHGDNNNVNNNYKKLVNLCRAIEYFQTLTEQREEENGIPTK